MAHPKSSEYDIVHVAHCRIVDTELHIYTRKILWSFNVILKINPYHNINATWELGTQTNHAASQILIVSDRTYVVTEQDVAIRGVYETESVSPKLQ